MALVNISQAIKLSKVSRQTFYTKYLDTGRISTIQDNKGNRVIDTAELKRVFGEVDLSELDKTGVQTGRQKTPTPDLYSLIASLETELRALRQQLAAANDTELRLRSELREAKAEALEREQRLNDHIERLTPKVQKQLTWFDRLLGRS